MVKIFLPLLFLILTFYSVGQTAKGKKEKFPSYFGIQVRPVLPTQFIGEASANFSKDGFSTTISQKLGHSFGGTVRAGLTKLIALETGINFTQRNFNIDMSVADSNVYATNDISFIQYDIPLNALIYVQLSEKFFMNASLGIALNFKPTDVGIVTNPGGSFSFTHTGRVNSLATVDLNANFGFEYRTEKSGFFYIGGSARVPFSPLFTLVSQYKYDGYKTTIYGDVDGSFLSVDFKYFFPNISKKGPQFQRGPIL
jgi:hypothetical protein